jgi:1-acyl-sn-glycerol-3-phosphate acyltransferase
MRVTSARKPWFLELARRYVQRRLRAQFDGLYVEGLAATRAVTEREPIILALTHVAWWDALLAVQLDALLGTHSYCLMDAENLARHPFFAWLGAMPIDRSTRKRALADMQRAATLLEQPRRLLWIFPQGKQRAAHLRPLGLQSGVRWLSRTSAARVIPVALSYAFREAAEPSILVSFGTPLAADTAGLMAALEEQLIASLARIDRFVECGLGDFVAVLPPRPARAGLPGAARLLGWLARGAAPKRLAREGARAS